jgi:multiple sugar transport system substrate-binding protein
MAEVDPASAVPLYFQLKNIILDRIERGELRPGDQVPTEGELCQRYRVSRTPVRQALLELSREGVLVRQAGRGTFVRIQEPSALTLRIMVPDERWRGPLDEAAARLSEAKSGQRLKLEVTAVPLTELHDRLLLAVAQGRAPDITVVDSVWVAELANRRYLFPLDELDPEWAAEVRDAFFPPLLTACQHKGSLQAVPANADATVLWFRRDWFGSEGLTAPATWHELLTAGRHFRKPEVRRRYGVGPHPLSFVGGRAGGETTTYQLLPLLWGAGGDLVAEGRVVLDSPANLRAVTFLRELVQEERIASTVTTRLPWDGALRDLAAGRVAMAFGGTYERFLIEVASETLGPDFDRRVGFAPLPSGPGGSSAPTIVGGMAYAITHQTRHPAIALELLRLATSPQALEHLSLATSQNTAHQRVAQSLQAPEGGFLQQAAGLFPGARARPALPGYDRVSSQFQELMELVIAGDMPLADLLARTAERISGITGFSVAGGSRAA